MIEQLKLLLDAAQWKSRDEDESVDYKAYRSSKVLIASLKSAIEAAEEFLAITNSRPADYDPFAHQQE